MGSGGRETTKETNGNHDHLVIFGVLGLPVFHTRDNHSSFRLICKALKVTGDVFRTSLCPASSGQLRLLCLILELPLESLTGED